MPNDLWINLPMKDPAQTRRFYSSLGFRLTSMPGNDDAFGLEVSDRKIMVMLFPEAMFSGFADAAVHDAAGSSEVLLSIGVDSREEVDDFVAKVRSAGGTVWGEPSESSGFMYGAGFADPDGHRWNLLYMDTEKMGQGR